MTRVLGLIDGSVYSESVCDLGAWVAGRTGATIELLHVLGRREVASAPDYSGSLQAGARRKLLEEITALDAQKAKLALRRGRLILEEAAARLSIAGVEHVETSLRHGDFVETLQAFEGKADLVIIGKRGEAADFAKLHLGSNLERVVRASTRPILLASRHFHEPRSFLVAFDGGPSVAKAIAHIAQGKLLQGMEGHLAVVGSPTSGIEAKLEEAAKDLRAFGYVIHTHRLQGEPEKAIAQRVEELGIGLLVMGAYGHSRIRTLIIGSTTTQMIRACRIPLLMFR
ncbi:MAG: universal stress protein [Geminicoccaceae bacterium]|nr:MAG: universal stress protein [Geminicoccaceae bacterium]